MLMCASYAQSHYEAYIHMTDKFGTQADNSEEDIDLFNSRI